MPNFEDFNGPFNRIHSPGEVNNGPRLVEPGESLPTRVLVERMMNSGLQLAVERALTRMYEFPVGEEVPDVFIGPRGRYNSDIVDVTNLRKWLQAKIQSDVEAAKAAVAKAEAEKAAAAASAAKLRPAEEPTA